MILFKPSKAVKCVDRDIIVEHPNMSVSDRQYRVVVGNARTKAKAEKKRLVVSWGPDMGIEDYRENKK